MIPEYAGGSRSHYDTLLFDVDNTLLDFDANEAESFRSMLHHMGEAYSEELYRTYKIMNEELWRSIERGEMTAKEVVNTRFTGLLRLYGREVDGAKWEQTYRFYLNQGIQEIPGVHRILDKLHSRYRMYVITNGLEDTQTSRMKRSGLDQYFITSFISAQVGAEKPSKAFFDYVKTHIDHFNATKTLVIGDSLTSDIKGGNMAGIDTCWFCKEGAECPTDIQPTYRIHQLEDLEKLL